MANELSQEQYAELLENVRLGKVKTFEVDSKSFSIFYQAWKDFPYQTSIEGITQKGGVIVYQQRNQKEK